MDRETIMNFMKERDFTLSAESRDGKGKTLSYEFLAEPTYHRHHKDRIVIPSYSCTVYPESKEFQLTYIVPHSINKLETPKCGSFDNEKHFNQICVKFETAVEALYQALGDE